MRNQQQPIFACELCRHALHTRYATHTRGMIHTHEVCYTHVCVEVANHVLGDTRAVAALMALLGAGAQRAAW